MFPSEFLCRTFDSLLEKTTMSQVEFDEVLHRHFHIGFEVEGNEEYCTWSHNFIFFLINSFLSFRQAELRQWSASFFKIHLQSIERIRSSYLIILISIYPPCDIRVSVWSCIVICSPNIYKPHVESWFQIKTNFRNCLIRELTWAHNRKSQANLVFGFGSVSLERQIFAIEMLGKFDWFSMRRYLSQHLSTFEWD